MDQSLTLRYSQDIFKTSAAYNGFWFITQEQFEDKYCASHFWNHKNKIDFWYEFHPIILSFTELKIITLLITRLRTIIIIILRSKGKAWRHVNRRIVFSPFLSASHNTRAKIIDDSYSFFPFLKNENNFFKIISFDSNEFSTI